jgi:hypothetical protein
MKEFTLVLAVFMAVAILGSFIFVLGTAHDEAKARYQAKWGRNKVAISNFRQKMIEQCKPDPSTVECQLFINGRWGCEDEACQLY